MSTTNKEEKVADVSTENIYRLNGRVPLKKAIPFGSDTYWPCLYQTWRRC